MKYYYGNDYKEAHTNAPIEITSVEQLRQYTENYNVVFPADDEIDLVLEEVDYTETKDGIAVDKFIFDDYQQGTYINIQFADDNDDGNVYYGKATHGYGYSHSADVYGELIDIIRDSYGKELTDAEKTELSKINTHDDELTLSPELLEHLAELNNVALYGKFQNL